MTNKKMVFDWSMGRGVVAFDGESYFYHKTSLDLFDSLKEPTDIATEASLESFNLAERTKIIEMFQGSEHNLFFSPTKQTARKRNLWMSEEEIEKREQLKVLGMESHLTYHKMNNLEGDELDTLVLFRMFSEMPYMFSPAKVRTGHSAKERVARELMILRSVKIDVGKAKPISAKEQFAKDIIANLPDYKTLEPKYKDYLGNGKKYSEVRVALIGVLAKHVKNRRGYDQLSGFHGHGYPSQTRSDFYYWGWRFLAKNPDNTMAGYQHAMRWLFHNVKQFVDTVPYPVDVDSF